MSFPNPFLNRRWLIFPFIAALILLVSDYGRMKQVERVKAVGREDSSMVNTSSHRHWLVVPEHNSRSYQWLAETEQMLSLREWRVRHVDYENVPAGREVSSPSPYRWWLGAVTWLVKALSNRPLGDALEHAALWAGPLMHLLLLVSSTGFVAWRFGRQPAILIAMGLVAFFPLAGEFLPGVPDDHGLVIACAWWSVLLLLDGVRFSRHSSFILSGIAGGFGLWIGVAIQVPVLAGIGGGALLLAAWEKSCRTVAPQPPRYWNSWALAGAVTSLAAYFVEYFPSHLDMRLQTNHPLHGLAWIGLGLLLTLGESWRAGRAGANVRTLVTAITALAALAALPTSLFLTNHAVFLNANAQAARLTNLPNGPVARNVAAWLGQDGLTLALVATGLPFLLLVPAGRTLFRRQVDQAIKAPSVIAGGVMLVSLVLACMHLQWWTMAQLALLSFLVVAAPPQKLVAWLVVTACALPGFIQLAGSAFQRDDAPFTRLEIVGLIERDIAHWIADHTDATGAVVLAAPERSPNLWFHGGLRGLGSPNWENREGVAATINILSANTANQAQALLEQRGVTHLVLASWDTELDALVQWAQTKPEDSFLSAMRHWALPPWAQPLPYRLPEIAGFPGQSVVILKMTSDTDRALSLSRLAEYALEVQDDALTAAVNDALQAFPSNLIALIGRAQIEKARNNAAALGPLFSSIEQSLTNRADRLLPWDRRVSLAVVLAQNNRNDLAREQVQRCLEKLDETRIRSLTTGSLFRLQVLGKNYGLHISDEPLRELARKLIPTELRSRL